LEEFSRDPELLAAKAVALGRCGDLEGAISFSDASIEESGGTPFVWLARGDVLLARRERRAEDCFNKALGLVPGDWFIAWLAARIRAFYRQFALALKLAREALERKPDHAALWLLAGTCQRELGLIGAARTSFQQARDLNPKLPEAGRALAGLSAAGLGARLSGWWRRHLSK
jgi:tetratricopeptide (TPR) repeat protein